MGCLFLLNIRTQSLPHKIICPKRVPLGDVENKYCNSAKNPLYLTKTN
jgi:hypothetical protein